MTEPRQARPSVLARTIRGAGWVMAWRWGSRALGLISTLVLVRLLAPDEIGLVALAASFMATVDGLMMLGTEEAVIRHPNPTRAVYDTAFTLNLLRGGVVTLLLLAVASPAAGFFEDPRLFPILLFIATLPLLDGVMNIGTVDFRRDMEFHKEFTMMVLPKLCGIVATIATALIRPDHVALMAGIAANRGMRTVMSYVLHPYRPRISLSAWRALIGYSAWTWILSLTELLRDRIDTLILGRLAGPGPVGIFSVGAEIAALPTTELVEPLCRASFAGFAVARRTGAPVRETALRLMGLAALITLPAGMGLSLVAAPLVAVALGPGWDAAVPVLAVLAPAGAMTVFGHIATHLFSAYGLLGRLTALACAGAALRAVLLAVLIPGAGAAGAARAVALALALEQAATLVAACRHFGIGGRDFTAQVWRPALATAAMTALLLATGLGWGTQSSVLALVGGVVAGAATYALVLVAAWWGAGRPAGAESDMLEGLGSVVRRRRAHRP